MKYQGGRVPPFYVVCKPAEISKLNIMAAHVVARLKVIKLELMRL